MQLLEPAAKWLLVLLCKGTALPVRLQPLDSASLPLLTFSPGQGKTREDEKARSFSKALQVPDAGGRFQLGALCPCLMKQRVEQQLGRLTAVTEQTTKLMTLSLLNPFWKNIFSCSQNLEVRTAAMLDDFEIERTRLF